jgi:FeS assembly SUF system protein
MADENDIEHLKANKISDPARVGLPMYGQPVEPSEADSEAYGGSGEEPSEPVDPSAVKERVVEVLETVYDPEIPVNIHSLGLIYGIEVDEKGHTEVEMTLTAPACPVAGMLVREVAQKVGEVDGVSTSHVKLVWDPPWTPERMSEEAQLELGML